MANNGLQQQAFLFAAISSGRDPDVVVIVTGVYGFRQFSFFLALLIFTFLGKRCLKSVAPRSEHGRPI
jgi:hypothetical protein